MVQLLSYRWKIQKFRGFTKLYVFPLEADMSSVINTLVEVKADHQKKDFWKLLRKNLIYRKRDRILGRENFMVVSDREIKGINSDRYRMMGDRR